MGKGEWEDRLQVVYKERRTKGKRGDSLGKSRDKIPGGGDGGWHAEKRFTMWTRIEP